MQQVIPSHGLYMDKATSAAQAGCDHLYCRKGFCWQAILEALSNPVKAPGGLSNFPCVYLKKVLMGELKGLVRSLDPTLSHKRVAEWPKDSL